MKDIKIFADPREILREGYDPQIISKVIRKHIAIKLEIVNYNETGKKRAGTDALWTVLYNEEEITVNSKDMERPGSPFNICQWICGKIRRDIEELHK